MIPYFSFIISYFIFLISDFLYLICYNARIGSRQSKKIETRVSVCVCCFFVVCLRVYVSACASGCLELFLRDLQASWTFSDALLKRDESILHESEKRLASLKHLATSWKHPNVLGRHRRVFSRGV